MVQSGKKKPKKKKVETTGRALEAKSSFMLWNIIFDHLNFCTTEEQRLFFNFEGLPVSANKLYKKNIYKNKKTDRMFINQKNTDEVTVLRIKVKKAIRDTGKKLEGKSTIAVVVMLESPRWLNKDRTPRKMDVDNSFKSLLDAIEKATGIPDEVNFQIMAFKVPSDVEKTRVYMYSLEDKYYSLEQ